MTLFLPFFFTLVQVGALSCAFVRGHARERDECMISLCTFGKLIFAGKNNTKKAAKAFKRVLDHTCLRAILSRFHHFNEHGGAFVRMNGSIIHFERACLVGIFADLPAAMKLTLTGSSCNTCFLPRDRMAEPNASASLRTWDNMKLAKSEYLARIASGETATTVLDEAKKYGVDCYVKSAFAIPRSGINPIGPDPNFDNPWANCPPVFLHGMESGTLMKVPETTLNYIIARAASNNISATKACRDVDAYCAKVYVANARNSNIEIGSMALLPLPHGITSHILVGKSLDGNVRASVARLMHMYVATCDMFNAYEQQQHCKMYEIVWRCREMMWWPLHRCRLDEVQALLLDMDQNLVKYMLPYSKSGCQSEKHHQWAHYCFHRKNTGCTAKEYAFERSYAVGHKKQIQFTNRAKTKALQTSAKHWFRNGVHRLAVHLQIHEPCEDELPAFRTDHLPRAVPAANFRWTSPAIKRTMETKANAMNPPLVLVMASTTLHVTLKNRLTQPGKKGRLVPVVFRAEYFGKQRWVDDIRVQYRDDDNVPAVGFARCLGFFADVEGSNYVGIQWYKICGRQSLQRIARMTKVELMESYQYVPVGSILNGALIVPTAIDPAPGYTQQCWVIQSHRESASIKRLNDQHCINMSYLNSKTGT